MKASEVLGFENPYIGKRFRLTESYTHENGLRVPESQTMYPRNKDMNGSIFVAAGIVSDEDGSYIIGIRPYDYQPYKVYERLWYSGEDYYECCEHFGVKDYAMIFAEDKIEWGV